MDTLKKLLKNKLGLIGFILISAFLLCTILAPYLATHSYQTQDLMNVLKPPGGEHLMGTDDLGRDIFSGILYGTRTSILIGVVVVLIGGVAGTFIGVVCGYFQGKLDLVVMRIVDTIMAFPTILVALVFVTIIGTGLKGAVLAIGLVSIPKFARVARASVASTKTREYIEAAEVLGQSHFKILVKHIIPNSMAPLIVQATLTFGESILTVAGLGFLGLGADPLEAEWGAMLSSARSYLNTVPHVAIFPGLAIALTVLGFNLLGDGLRDTLDVRD